MVDIVPVSEIPMAVCYLHGIPEQYMDNTVVHV